MEKSLMDKSYLEQLVADTVEMEVQIAHIPAKVISDLSEAMQCTKSMLINFACLFIIDKHGIEDLEITPIPSFEDFTDNIDSFLQELELTDFGPSSKDSIDPSILSILKESMECEKATFSINKQLAETIHTICEQKNATASEVVNSILNTFVCSLEDTTEDLVNEGDA